MKTIKLIDLLVKIANGEEAPKKIIYKGRAREFDYEDKDYTCIGDTDYYLFHDTLAEGTGDKMVTGLNDEVEIIEDTPKEDKKIEKLDLEFDDGFIKEHFIGSSVSYLSEYTALKMLYEKQSEIIDKINGE